MWLATTLPLWLIAPATVPAQDAHDVFFAAVGSEHYAEIESRDVRSFARIHGAARSAERVAGILLRGGARFGVVLISDHNNFVGREDIYAALDRVLSEARDSAADSPLVVFYFAGHGISEGVGWNLFSVPGDLVLEKEPLSTPDLESLAEHALHVADIVSRLDAAGTPYVVIIDTCYKGEAARFKSPVLSVEASRKLADVAEILRFINQFHQSDPVLFSTEPGTLVSTAPDPRSSGGLSSVAPLARRATIIADAAFDAGRSLSLSAFIADMTRASLDLGTKPAITYAEPDVELWNRLLFDHHGNEEGDVEMRVGTVTGPTPCCMQLGRSVSQPASLNTMRLARLEISGHPEDFITGGRNMLLSDENSEVTILSWGADGVSIDFESGESFWSVELSVPDGERFVPRQYKNAVRFGERSRPTIDVSGYGRGCNETRGNFTVKRAEYDKTGELKELVVVFTQVCDSSAGPLFGRIAVKRR